MPMVMPLPNEDYEKDTKSVVVKYKFEPQEIYVHYYMSSAFRKLIDTNKYFYIDEFLCLKSPECIEFRNGKYHIKDTSPAFLRLYCIGKEYLIPSGSSLQHSRGGWKCIQAVKESTIDNVDDDAFSNIISGGQEVNGTTHVLVQNKLPDLISGSLVYCFRIPAGRSSDHGSSFSK